MSELSVSARPPARLAGVLDPCDGSPAVRARWAAWLAVQAHFSLRPVQAAACLRADADPEALLAREGLRPLAPAALGPALRRLADCGAVAVPFGTPAYPARWARIDDPAPLLLVRGDVGCLRRPAVALVGSRAASAYGRSVARSLAEDLALAGLCVISGLARGIDAEAHEGALAAGGDTLAVMACGPDRVYPPEHRDLAARIAARGALVTEFPLGTPPRGPYFPLRNRLIAAAARAVVVVEGRHRSGSLVTARHALAQGVEVLAVPGPITSPGSEGPNQLLRDGAGPALEADDVLAAAGLAPDLPFEGPPGAAPPAGLAGELLARIAKAAPTRDELGRGLRAPAGAVSAALLSLELEGWVAEGADGRLHTLAGPRER